MKKIIFIVLCLFFVGISYGQFNDTLQVYYGTPGDSVRYFTGPHVSTLLGAESIAIKLEADGNSPVDSIRVRSGTILRDKAGNPYDTVFTTVPGYDSSWTAQSTFINDGDGAGFTLLSFTNEILEFTILNTRPDLADRSVTIVIDVREKK